MSKLIDVCIPYGPRPDLVEPYLKALQAWNHENVTPFVQGIWSDNGTFSQSRSRNAAAKCGNAPWILFVDADMVIEPSGMKDLVSLATDSVPSVYTLVGWRTPDDAWPERTDQPLPKAITDWFAADYSPEQWHALYDGATLWRGNAVYGPVLLPRSAWEALNGYCEDFSGWGGEDDDFLIRLRQYGFHLNSRQHPGFIQCPHKSTRLVDPPGVKDSNLKLLAARNESYR